MFCVNMIRHFLCLYRSVWMKETNGTQRRVHSRSRPHMNFQSTVQIWYLLDKSKKENIQIFRKIKCMKICMETCEAFSNSCWGIGDLFQLKNWGSLFNSTKILNDSEVIRGNFMIDEKSFISYEFDTNDIYQIVMLLEKNRMLWIIWSGQST